VWKRAEPLTRDQVRQAVVLTGAQVCATAGVSENTVRKWVREGTLPCVTVGGSRFIPAKAFLELMGDDGRD
jgi:excisionase family DNA binding protein